MRNFRPGIVCAMSTLTLLLVTGLHALAEGECQLGFERWAKFSKARLRTPPPGDDRGACLESEFVRKELLDGLARNRATCQSATSSSEQSPQQTMTMIDINDGFIRSLGLCPKEERSETGAEWTTRSQTAAPKQLEVTTPKQLEVNAPKQLPAAAPKQLQATAPKSVTPPVAATRSCLDVEHGKAGHYTIVNRHCAGQTVLAVVETRDTAGKTACKGYSFSGTITVGTDMTAALNVNHQCVLNRGSCTSKHLGSMFPECDW